jgi:uncharacterized protein YebE (UPF0316 family)
VESAALQRISCARIRSSPALAHVVIPFTSGSKSRHDRFLTILLILSVKTGMDILFLAKIDAFNRANRIYYIVVSFIETAFGIFGLSFVLQQVGSNYAYIFAYALGAVAGGLISSKIKAKLDDRLEGQRKFFARITLEEHVDEADLVEKLREGDFDFVVKKEQYLTGQTRTVIQGSLDDRKRMWQLKDILRGRKGKHLVILRAEDIFFLR